MISFTKQPRPHAGNLSPPSVSSIVSVAFTVRRTAMRSKTYLDTQEVAIDQSIAQTRPVSMADKLPLCTSER